jgi:hypothetical protein
MAASVGLVNHFGVMSGTGFGAEMEALLVDEL